MKKTVNIGIGLILLLLFQTAVFAAGITLQASPVKVQSGAEITVAGTTAPNGWVTIKGLDQDGSIVYLNAVAANGTGVYSDTFKGPEISSGILKIIAGSGTDTASAAVEIARSSGGDSNGDSTGGTAGGSTDGSAPAPAPKPQPAPIETKLSADGKSTTTGTTAQAETNTATGAASAKVASDIMTSLADKAKESEAAGRKAVVEIKVEAPTSAKTVGVEIPRSAFDQVAVGTKAEVKVSTGLGSITFSAKAVDAISGSAGAGDISITISKVEPSTLSEDMQKLIGDRPLFDFTVTAGNAEISKFGGGSAQVSVPYTLKQGEKKNAIVVYYIDSVGKLTPVKGRYNEATGTVSFTTSHFSQYTVGYNDVNFSDVAGTAWYSEAVGFIAARGIATGMGDNHYSPQAQLTRGQFVTMVMRAYGIEAEHNLTENFSDAGNAYYTDYLGTAKKLGITTGIGNNRYAPEKEITRQEMFTLLYNTLKTIGELPQATDGKELAVFNDSHQVAVWAKDAMALFVKTGTISGTGGLLNPTETTNRAQMAQVLYRLLGE